MPLGEEEVRRRVAEFSATLRAAGFRLTHQRLEVVREVAGTDSHPEADQIFDGVRDRVPTISMDTVYRTLGTLAGLGMVNRVAGATGAARYDANTAGHHHFLCTRCGLLRDLEGDHTEDLRIPAAAELLGRVSRVEMRLTGVCHACAASDGICAPSETPMAMSATIRSCEAHGTEWVHVNEGRRHE